MAEGTPLYEDLGIEAGMTVGVLNVPNHYDIDFGELPDGVDLHREERPSDLFVVYAADPAEAERGFARAETLLSPGGAIWVVWAREQSGIGDDLDEETLRDLFEAKAGEGARAFDDTWSGLRFVPVGGDAAGPG